MGVPRQELPSWDDVQVLTAQLARKPLLDDDHLLEMARRLGIAPADDAVAFDRIVDLDAFLVRQQFEPRWFVLQCLADGLDVNGAALDDPDEARSLVLVSHPYYFVSKLGVPVDDLCHE